jgi:hypothetical protein
MKTPILLSLLALPAFAIAADLQFVGTAKPISGGDPIYQEAHTVSGTCTDGVFVPQSQSVDYTRDSSDAFATKTLQYQQSVLRPTVTFRQPDFSEVVEIINQNGETLRVIWQSPSGATETSTLTITPALVADAGFDNLVRKNWNKLVNDGESVKFDMVAPTRGDYYGFVLEPHNDTRIDAAHTFRIRPSSMVIGWLVDPILLGYNAQGLLTDYLGLTNIRKDQDTNYNAHIRYAINTTPECELTR